MELPKLRVRPLSTQSCTEFRGINRTPTAGMGWWADERNLSTDKRPCLAVRRGRATVPSIDGNAPTLPIAAMVGGDHVVLLDQKGNFWCNGNPWSAPIHGGLVSDQIMHYEITITQPVQANVTITPTEGVDPSWEDLNELGVSYSDETHVWTIIHSDIRFRCTDMIIGRPIRFEWECDNGSGGETWTPGDPADYNIQVTGDNDITGLEFKVHIWEGLTRGVDHRTLIRMGARVIDIEDKLWFNAVKLAAGTFNEETDAGYLYADIQNVAGYVGDEFTMVLCDEQGNAYNGVVVSSSEPMTQEGYWLDTSTATPTLREWNYLETAWVTITSTFVKVGPFVYSAADDPRAGDTVDFAAYSVSTSDAEALLNGSHYLYNVINNDGFYFVISGMLSADSVTDTGLITVTRDVPTMDFVVECGNRLWGCRYSEANNLNEIYASKLGDPTNWEVFQGLATDSWRASRGTPAPFTGAAVLDGCPLFFRAESLEKVFPSASGAHQIQTYDLEGVEPGADRSLVVIEDRLYYKSPNGVMVYTGTLPSRVSEPLGDLSFRGGNAARHYRKYVLGTTLVTQSGEEPVVLVYDTVSGIWHMETETWDGDAITWKDEMYYVYHGVIYKLDGMSDSDNVQWYAETHPITLELPEHRWITYLRIRFKTEAGATMKVYLSYDDGPWQLKRSITRSTLGTDELTIRPRRCDHFRLKLDGMGGVQIYEISYRLERSQGVH